MSGRQTWRHAAEKLRAGRGVMLLVVADSRPPAPGHAGFKMVVCEDGTMEGTIGGGSIELEMTALALDKLVRKDITPEVRTLRHQHAPGQHRGRKEAPASGMICGGSQTVLMLALGARSLPAIGRIVERLGSGEDFAISLTPDGISLPPAGAEPGITFIPQSGSGFMYRENVCMPTVYIVGGGHVALALSELLAGLDFRIVVMDDRPDASTVVRNRFAHRKLVIQYSDAGDSIPEGSGTYVVIMTPSHQHDEEVLHRLIRKKFAYLGMMGSPAKVGEIFRRLRAAGIRENELAGVHAPIGLPIHSRTAAEIAVSIAAQLVEIRNRPAAARTGSL